jgi:CheY-like chemotaxis protein
VDDDSDVRSLLSMVVAAEGYEVTTAADGADAIAAIRRHRPDVILLDLMMPGIDGWSFLDLYRQLPGPHAPVVVVTAAAAAARNAVSHAVGEVVPKPFRVDHLLDVLRKHAGQAAA